MALHKAGTEFLRRTAANSGKPPYPCSSGAPLLRAEPVGDTGPGPF